MAVETANVMWATSLCALRRNILCKLDKGEEGHAWAGVGESPTGGTRGLEVPSWLNVTTTAILNKQRKGVRKCPNNRTTIKSAQLKHILNLWVCIQGNVHKYYKLALNNNAILPSSLLMKNSRNFKWKVAHLSKWFSFLNWKMIHAKFQTPAMAKGVTLEDKAMGSIFRTKKVTRNSSVLAPVFTAEHEPNHWVSWTAQHWNLANTDYVWGVTLLSTCTPWSLEPRIPYIATLPWKQTQKSPCV